MASVVLPPSICRSDDLTNLRPLTPPHPHRKRQGRANSPRNSSIASCLDHLTWKGGADLISVCEGLSSDIRALHLLNTLVLHKLADTAL
uniref:Uncharacterized protein n=1 Tax=Electrophorus electricus TaxID=8005 RepID=A0A4W4EVJ0_ELEEL